MSAISLPCDGLSAPSNCVADYRQRGLPALLDDDGYPWLPHRRKSLPFICRLDLAVVCWRTCGGG